MKLSNFYKELMADKKQKVAALSIISNTLLVIFKLVAGILTNSVSIIAEAIHSSLDLLAAIIAFTAVKISGHPPDKTHRYGHGKFENVSGSIEALLIFIAAIWIISEAYQKIINGSAVETISIGIGVMAFASLANWIISGILMKTARETDSIALEADAMHLRTDVYTSLGVMLGLLVLSLTRIQILDPLIALCVALLIIKAAYELTVKAVLPLLDVALPPEEEAEIENALKMTMPQGISSFHQLRTRKAGSERYVDMHLVVQRDLNIAQVHDICDQIENEIELRLSHVHVMVHAEPCGDEDCEHCQTSCERLRLKNN
ncbi:MAG TPA: cation diffusion facilitator family transporter [Syntrophomonadaceae bacterium]|nr:cation diffusion facilitator family transporter [Syntrophomonadaceae bacterium]HNX29309.1 cation diffusion facilitator family transporter [Syntrophomonadaceae bacterium]HPR93005.1 cation diffusion facilitator family transporter [Syntrophomonadaceae bacterium]